MGRVVEAYDTVLGRVVAIKEALLADPELLRRFRRETQITARLEHPSIVPVLDAGTSEDGTPYYVMRKVSGRPLADLVKTAPALADRLGLLPHLLAASRAVAHAHTRGVIHRDLKPSNILVGELGETIVIDWGLAKVVDDPDDDEVPAAEPLAKDSLRTRIGTVVGTPGFMSPEQVAGDVVDMRSDVYALGATLYYVLALRAPYDTATAILGESVREPITPLAELAPGVPVEIAAIVGKALAADPRARYANAGELAQDLDRFLTGQLVASHRYSQRERMRRFLRRHRTSVAIAAAALVVLAIGAWFAIGRIVAARDETAAALEVALDRNDRLVLNQARQLLDTDPTAAVALLKPLARTHAREVRAIGMAARAQGVAWSFPASRSTSILKLAGDGKRLLSAGHDGVIRIHDLAARSTKVVTTMQRGVRVSWVDGDRAIAVSFDNVLKIIPFDGAEREVELADRIVAIETSSDLIWVTDANSRLWRIGVADLRPVQVELDDSAAAIHVSPDGRWVAVSGDRRLWAIARDGRAIPLLEDAFPMDWAVDSKRLVAGYNKTLVVYDIVGDSVREAYRAVLDTEFVLFDAMPVGETVIAMTPDLWVVRPTGKRRIEHLEQASPLYKGWGGAIVLGIEGARVLVQKSESKLVLRPPAASLQRVEAAPHSPYVVGAIEGAIVAWKIDDLLPRVLHEGKEPVGSSVLGKTHFLLQDLTGESVWIDSVTGDRRTVHLGNTLYTIGTEARLPIIIGPARGDVMLVVRAGGQGIVVRRDDGASTAIDGTIGVVRELDDDRALIGFVDGRLTIYDFRSARMETLATLPATPTHVASQSSWAVVGYKNDNGLVLWRRDLATSRDSSQPLSFVPADFAIAADGNVYFGEGERLRRWGTDGSITDLIALHARIKHVIALWPTHVMVILDEGSMHSIDLRTKRSFGLGGVGASLNAIHSDIGITLAKNNRPRLFDPINGVGWHLEDRLSSAWLSSDGQLLYGRLMMTTLVWSLQIPSEAGVGEWLDKLTNAIAPSGPGALQWSN